MTQEKVHQLDSPDQDHKDEYGLKPPRRQFDSFLSRSNGAVMTAISELQNGQHRIGLTVCGIDLERL